MTKGAHYLQKCSLLINEDFNGAKVPKHLGHDYEEECSNPARFKVWAVTLLLSY